MEPLQSSILCNSHSRSSVTYPKIWRNAHIFHRRGDMSCGKRRTHIREMRSSAIEDVSSRWEMHIPLMRCGISRTENVAPPNFRICDTILITAILPQMYFDFKNFINYFEKLDCNSNIFSAILFIYLYLIVLQFHY